jgi:hypothetical protein
MSKVFSGPTPTPWEYIPSTEHHGPYVTCLTGDICDCYTMSNPAAASVRNGGDSYPIHHQGKQADANAQRIVLAVNNFDALVEELNSCAVMLTVAASDLTNKSLDERIKATGESLRIRGLADTCRANAQNARALLRKLKPEKPKDTLLPPSSQSTGDE